MSKLQTVGMRWGAALLLSIIMISCCSSQRAWADNSASSESSSKASSETPPAESSSKASSEAPPAESSSKASSETSQTESSSEAPPAESLDQGKKEKKDQTKKEETKSKPVVIDTRSTVLENVDAMGEQFLNTDLDWDSLTPDQKEMFSEYLLSQKGILEKRQFLTVRTSEGSIYYIIINHGEAGNNVYFLKEVSDKDIGELEAHSRVAKNTPTSNPGTSNGKDLPPQPTETVEKSGEDENPLLKYTLIIIGVVVTAVIIYFVRKKKNDGINISY